MAAKLKKRQKFWIRFTLLLIIFVMSYWAYDQFAYNFRNMELSNRMIEAMLENKTALAKQYAKDLGILKQDLTRAETILAEVQKENDQLHQQVQLANTVADLEREIAQLKERNQQLLTDVDKSPYFEKSIMTIAQGKGLLAQCVDKLKKIKQRMGEIRQEEHSAKVAARMEKDKIKLLVGNNGFLVRNGKFSPVDIVLPAANKNVTIDVQFVK
jgi:CHASE3 domain sensor protein